MLSALEIFWVMRYTNLLFTYLLTTTYNDIRVVTAGSRSPQLEGDGSLVWRVTSPNFWITACTYEMLLNVLLFLRSSTTLWLGWPVTLWTSDQVTGTGYNTFCIFSTILLPGERAPYREDRELEPIATFSLLHRGNKPVSVETTLSAVVPKDAWARIEAHGREF